MSSNRQYPIPRYALATIVIVVLVLFAIVFVVPLAPAKNEPSKVLEAKYVVTHDSQPCINSDTKTYAYLKAEFTSNGEVLSYVDVNGDLVVRAYIDNTLNWEYIYPDNLCLWKQTDR